MLTKALENFQFVSDMILVTFICSLHDEKAGGSSKIIIFSICILC